MNTSRFLFCSFNVYCKHTFRFVQHEPPPSLCLCLCVSLSHGILCLVLVQKHASHYDQNNTSQREKIDERHTVKWFLSDLNLNTVGYSNGYYVYGIRVLYVCVRFVCVVYSNGALLTLGTIWSTQ